MAVIFTVMLTLPVIIVNAIPNDSSDYRCDKVDPSKTIGQVECCEVDIKDGELYCTICDGTNPPSNCSERYLQIVYKEEPVDETDESISPKTGGVLEKPSDQQLEQTQPSESQDNGISVSEGIPSDSSSLGATFNTQQENGNSNEEGNNDTS